MFMKKKTGGIFSKIVRNVDFPSDAYCGEGRIEIYSGNEAVTYGVRGIVDYTSDCIVLLRKNDTLSFHGEYLSCDCFVEGAVCIRGYITSLHIDRIK